MMPGSCGCPRLAEAVTATAIAIAPAEHLKPREERQAQLMKSLI